MFGRMKVVEQLRGHRASLQRRHRAGIPARWMTRMPQLFTRLFRRLLLAAKK